MAKDFVGCDVESIVGYIVGSLVGVSITVGSKVERLNKAFVGVIVDGYVDAIEGAALGDFDGLDDGFLVGFNIISTVGLCVG